MRVWIRRTSSTRAFDELPVERHYGELTDDEALRDAMRGVDTVFYCVVDARAWLHDPAPLFATNVDGLRHALDAALEDGGAPFRLLQHGGHDRLRRTAARGREQPHTWQHLGGPYIQARVAAEDLVLSYCRERALPGVVMCVSTTYGAPDYGSPHGRMVADAARGKMPVYFDNASMEVVGSPTPPAPSSSPPTRGRSASGTSSASAT